MKKLLILCGLFLACNTYTSENPSFVFYCSVEEKVRMKLEGEGYKIDTFETMTIKGDCKNCDDSESYDLRTASMKFDVELQKSDKEGKKKFQCLYQPVLTRMNCNQRFGDLLVIKMSSKKFFLTSPLISNRDSYSWITLSKGSCVSFKP